MAAIRQFCWWRIFLEGRGKVRDKKKIKRSVRWKSLGELGVGERTRIMETCIHLKFALLDLIITRGWGESEMMT